MESQPGEIILCILSFCDSKTVRRFGATCTLHYELSNDQNLWKELSKKKKHPKMDRSTTNTREWYFRMEKRIELIGERTACCSGTLHRSVFVEPKNTTVKKLYQLFGGMFMIGPHNLTLSKEVREGRGKPPKREIIEFSDADVSRHKLYHKMKIIVGSSWDEKVLERL